MSPIEIIVRGHLTAQGIARTWQIALRLRTTTPQARRLMAGLERKGVVRRSERYSAVNDLCWELSPANPADLGASDAGLRAPAHTPAPAHSLQKDTPQ